MKLNATGVINTVIAIIMQNTRILQSSCPINSMYRTNPNPSRTRSTRRQGECSSRFSSTRGRRICLFCWARESASCATWQNQNGHNVHSWCDKSFYGVRPWFSQLKNFWSFIILPQLLGHLIVLMPVIRRQRISNHHPHGHTANPNQIHAIHPPAASRSAFFFPRVSAEHPETID